MDGADPAIQIDDLVYSYDKGNQLQNVVDNERHPEGYNDRTPDVRTPDFKYDPYGNLVEDRDKEIKEIIYNHMNLPIKILIGSDGKIEYIYNAAGTKLKKIVTEGSAEKITEYVDGFIYFEGNLDFFPTAEGYVQVSEDRDTYEYQYVFQYKDHLGNVRLSYADLDDDGSIDPLREILEEKNYYPFGLEHKGYNNVVIGPEYNYKTFQGQERTEDLGLNVLEFKYRIHDPAIGRFWQIDPLAEDFPHNGTYNFSENRVIDAIELEGLESYIVTGRAFIPQDKLSNPTPWGKSDSYKGDNRMYYSANSTAFRTEQSVRLDFDNNTSTTLSNVASETVGLDKNGNEVQRSSAGEAGTVSSDIEKGGVNLEFSATNKLSKSENPFTPSIDGEFNITISPNIDGTFDFNVDVPRVDGFPAYEIWVTDETNGGTFLLFGRNPIESREGPGSLYGNGEHSGSTSGNSETRRAENGQVEFKDKKNDF